MRYIIDVMLVPDAKCFSTDTGSLASVCTSGACGNSKISSSNLFILFTPLFAYFHQQSFYLHSRGIKRSFLVSSYHNSFNPNTSTIFLTETFFLNKSKHYKWTKELLRYQSVGEIAERLKKTPNTQNVRLLERNGRDYKTFLY